MPQGLLGFAFGPSFTSTGIFYVSYTFPGVAVSTTALPHCRHLVTCRMSPSSPKHHRHHGIFRRGFETPCDILGALKCTRIFQQSLHFPNDTEPTRRFHHHSCKVLQQSSNLLETCQGNVPVGSGLSQTLNSFDRCACWERSAKFLFFLGVLCHPPSTVVARTWVLHLPNRRTGIMPSSFTSLER